MNQANFQVKDVVFAKYRRYQFWPAQILEIKGDIYLIQFYENGLEQNQIQQFERKLCDIMDFTQGCQKYLKSKNKNLIESINIAKKDVLTGSCIKMSDKSSKQQRKQSISNLDKRSRKKQNKEKNQEQLQQQEQLQRQKQVENQDEPIFEIIPRKTRSQIQQEINGKQENQQNLVKEDRNKDEMKIKNCKKQIAKSGNKQENSPVQNMKDQEQQNDKKRQLTKREENKIKNEIKKQQKNDKIENQLEQLNQEKQEQIAKNKTKSNQTQSQKKDVQGKNSDKNSNNKNNNKNKNKNNIVRKGRQRKQSQEQKNQNENLKENQQNEQSQQEKQGNEIKFQQNQVQEDQSENMESYLRRLDSEEEEEQELIKQNLSQSQQIQRQQQQGYSSNYYQNYDNIDYSNNNYSNMDCSQDLNFQTYINELNKERKEREQDGRNDSPDFGKNYKVPDFGGNKENYQQQQNQMSQIDRNSQIQQKILQIQNSLKVKQQYQDEGQGKVQVQPFGDRTNDLNLDLDNSTNNRNDKNKSFSQNQNMKQYLNKESVNNNISNNILGDCSSDKQSINKSFYSSKKIGEGYIEDLLQFKLQNKVIPQLEDRIYNDYFEEDKEAKNFSGEHIFGKDYGMIFEEIYDLFLNLQKKMGQDFKYILNLVMKCIKEIDKKVLQYYHDYRRKRGGSKYELNREQLQQLYRHDSSKQVIKIEEDGEVKTLGPKSQHQQLQLQTQQQSNYQTYLNNRQNMIAQNFVNNNDISNDKSPYQRERQFGNNNNNQFSFVQQQLQNHNQNFVDRNLKLFQNQNLSINQQSPMSPMRPRSFSPRIIQSNVNMNKNGISSQQQQDNKENNASFKGGFKNYSNNNKSGLSDLQLNVKSYSQ
ncbi:hypothetical protein PPERSA_07281 [Pseudocohnilembus persalinus]|uniref:PWWP domain-containing protein n=1 Tax=Pseudocohnilembus persalinus TaxID=266149 RepID=A0A0V0QCZ5_PSEPJ|nr:hypothetical protein PPERSA_07281 [Pseudocohnilembus persalinus]|eukprot:KRX00084.1 hypothetical protein PPERSA_07281 [Pseudocohnilembus persalinus]